MCCGPLHQQERFAETAEELMRSRYGLEIVGTRAGRSDDDEGEVEFRARYRLGGQRGVLHERSRFARRAGRWVYVDPMAAHKTSLGDDKGL